jgi:hypothetical protein
MDGWREYAGLFLSFLVCAVGGFVALLLGVFLTGMALMLLITFWVTWVPDTVTNVGVIVAVLFAGWAFFDIMTG